MGRTLGQDGSTLQTYGKFSTQPSKVIACAMFYSLVCGAARAITSLVKAVTPRNTLQLCVETLSNQRPQLQLRSLTTARFRLSLRLITTLRFPDAHSNPDFSAARELTALISPNALTAFCGIFLAY